MIVRRPSPLALALAVALAAGTLSACAPLVVGGAAVGAMITVDRRTSGAQLEDENIELRGSSRMRDAFGDRAHVNVTSYNRQVLLTGEVPSDQAKQQAEQIAARLDNVRAVVNELGVTLPSSYAARSNDTFITGKVKASIVDEKELYIGAYRIVTERGVVYLMGRVTPREADKATQIARNTGGVQRVVRVFEPITEGELREMAGRSDHVPVTNANPQPVMQQPVPAPGPAVAPEPPPVATPTPVR